MDFVEELPRVHGKSVILTVVDRFSKYAHFIALGHPYTTSSSDRHPVFTAPSVTFKMAGVQLRMSAAFHPQTNGQSEVTNQTIAMYLRCITGNRPRA
ncbi:hypothetical protein U9M48_041912 [Paspalum notatum var. saurae]|uniref:Integrase catalytic domain-containing protein n=1 Tax=Paspalum notatum var. saurae TaxID=547442 RepID=A0AAQ3URR1_PASNO